MQAHEVLHHARKTHQGFSIVKPFEIDRLWTIRDIPVASLKLPDDVEHDPYNRVIMLDYDHIDRIQPEEICAIPIIVDSEGFVLDGNHRATKARLLGLKTITAFCPV